MKSELRLHVQYLNLPGGKLANGETWIDRFKQWLPSVDDLLLNSVDDDERGELGEALVKALTELGRFVYLARRERDVALGLGYERFPKGDYNSASQEALARKYASEEVGLRELMNEIEIALKLKFELNRTAMVNYREAVRTP